MELTENQIVWTCEMPMENNPGSDTVFTRPWQVKLMQLNDTKWLGNGFNHETGIMDFGSHFTIIATKNNCFLTKKEANDCYESHLVYEIQAMQAHLEEFIEQRIKQGE
jgi:hypothetical protein